MNNRLKNYRKDRKLSKKQVAKKLKITLDEYITIESGDKKITNKLKERIEGLFERKNIKLPKGKGLSSWLSTYDKLPKGIKPFTVLDEKINKLPIGIDNISLNTIRNIGIPKSPITDMTKSMQMDNSVFDRPTLSDILSSSVISKSMSWVDLVHDRNKDFDWISPLVKTQFTIHNGLNELLESSTITNISNATDFWKDINDINKTARTISETIAGNQKLYNDYLNFNSELSKSIIGFTDINEYYSKENFLKGPKFLTAFDIISGTTFVDQLDTFDDDDQTDEIIEEFKDNEDFNEQNQSFLNEFTEIIESEGVEVSKETLSPLYVRIYDWVGEYFTVSQLLQVKITRRLVYQLIMLTMAVIAMKNAAIIRINQTDMKENQQKELKLKEEQLQLLNKVWENQNIDGVEVLQAKGRVNLRKQPNIKSRILAVVPKKQNVTVIKRNRVWVLIAYEEFDTKNPRAGWVKAEFFEKIL